jgi:hypothetical protein
MLFGSVSDFAIQAEVEPELTPPSAVWGRMCVWCRGIALGDIEDTHCSLYLAACSFKWVAGHLDELWDERLVGLDDINALAFLDAAYYGDDDRTTAQLAEDARRYGKFNFLTNWGEQFDGVKAFLICSPEGSLRIVYQLLDGTRGSAEVTKAGFVAAAKAFVHWFGEQSERLRG